MRKIILSAIVATVAALSFAAPSQAGGYGYNSGYVTVGGYGYDNDYGNSYGHRRHHRQSYQNDYGYEPSCFTKKIKRWDSYGNLIVKRIRVCN